jgi:isoamylase
MIVMGDELALTHNGNNNWYGHDNKMTQMDWSALENQQGSLQADFHRFMTELLNFRKAHPALGSENFLG